MTLTRRHFAVAAALSAAAVVTTLALRASLAPAPAPDLRLTLLDGQQLQISALRGQVVLVNFWATSCGICVAEMPALVATHQKYRAQGYQTLAVSMQYDPPALVARFAEQRQLPFGVVIDNTGAIARGFGDVRATPTSVLINKRGEIVARYQGAPDFAALHRRVEQLLAEAEPGREQS